MNAGAYGGEMSDVIKEVTFLDENLDFQTAKATDLSYSYRHSYFMDHPGCVIVEAVMELWAQASCEIEAEMADFTKRRKEKQPFEYPSAGSTFKRPPGYYTGPLYPAGRSCRPCHGRRSSEQKAYGLCHQS